MTIQKQKMIQLFYSSGVPLYISMNFKHIIVFSRFNSTLFIMNISLFKLFMRWRFYLIKVVSLEQKSCNTCKNSPNFRMSKRKLNETILSTSLISLVLFWYDFHIMKFTACRNWNSRIIENILSLRVLILGD